MGACEVLLDFVKAAEAGEPTASYTGSVSTTQDKTEKKKTPMWKDMLGYGVGGGLLGAGLGASNTGLDAAIRHKSGPLVSGELIRGLASLTQAGRNDILKARFGLGGLGGLVGAGGGALAGMIRNLLR